MADSSSLIANFLAAALALPVSLILVVGSAWWVFRR